LISARGFAHARLVILGLCAVALVSAEAEARTPTKPSAAQRGTTTAPKSGSNAKRPPAASPQQQQSLQREQRDLQAELAKLKRQLAATEASRSAATDALASSEIAISKVNRRLRELATARERVERQIAALAARERDVASRQGERSRQLDAWLQQQQRLTLRDPLHLLLEGDDPDRLAREAQYLAYLARDAEALVEQLGARRLELVALKEESTTKSEELTKIAEDERNSRLLLEQEQARRKQALDRLSKQAVGQRQSIARLERDEQRLGALIERISAVLAEQKRKELERARLEAERAAAARAAARKAEPPGRTPAEAARPSIPQSLASGTNFAQMRGKVPLPVQGTVTARFGAPRRGDAGATGPSWKGIFIRAPTGADVKAVGAGQVVFADWLRGFGNLLVIDHGDGYLSIYGNNESLLRNAGDRIAVGDTVASVGNTGGNDTPGLYFELRFQGRPFDPLSWVAAR
jgi:septal ring factor EnvC (AmiA/AmiB activator)